MEDVSSPGRSWRRSTERADVYSITGTRRSAVLDQRARQARYLWSMGIRTVCFGLAIVTTGPFRWVFIAAAVLLPYIAVVMANAGRERVGAEPERPGVLPLVALEGRPAYDVPAARSGASWPDDGAHTTGH